MIDSIRTARFLAVVVATVVVAGCSVGPGASDRPVGGLGSPSASAGPASSATARPSPTAVPIATATPSLEASAAPSPESTSNRNPIRPEDLPHADAALETVLPTRIGETDLLRSSYLGSDFVGGGDVCGFICPLEPQMMAEGVGATTDDVTLAVAFDPTVERYLLVAWRVAGASGAELRASRIAMLDGDPPFPLVEDYDVGDRTVTVAVRSWFPNDTNFLVPSGDALIVVSYPTGELSGDDAVLPDGVRSIVEALP